MRRRDFVSALTGATGVVSISQIDSASGNNILLGTVEGEEDLETEKNLGSSSDLPPQPKAQDIDLPGNTDLSFGFTRIKDNSTEKLAVYVSIINTSGSPQNFTRSVKIEGKGVQRVEQVDFKLEARGNHVSFYTHPNIESVDSIYIL